MTLRSMLHAVGGLLLLAISSSAQSIVPSNGSELGTQSTYPRFLVNASGSVSFPSFEIAPLGPYATIPRGKFMALSTFQGRLVNTNPNNANAVRPQDFSYVSCDGEDYMDANLGPGDVLRIIVNLQMANSVVLYSRHSLHCVVDGINSLPLINGVFTTMDPVVAGQVADLNFTQGRNAYGTIRADLSSYTNGSSGGWQNGANYNPSPTTAIAMIILYSITGIITALFVLIIITGAVRAHRHPERYGPRNVAGRSRQSRAKGIARAMLETLPIVKFGDHQDTSKKEPGRDVEMSAQSAGVRENTAEKEAVATVIPATTADTIASSSSERSGPTNADGSDETGTLGCSICTEDFQKGEEVRVLPCNHKFHPICVDPWLLNVSGTCPLCRIDLRPKSDAANEGPSGRRGSVAVDETAGGVSPPLGQGSSSGQTGTIQNLRAALSGSREERIAALRRFRHERQSNGASIERRPTRTEGEESQPGLSSRLRDRFRIRTRRHDGA